MSTTYPYAAPPPVAPVLSQAAGWWQRAGAILLDLLITYALSFAAGFAVGSLAGPNANPDFVAGGGMLAAAVASCAYWGLTMGRSGAHNGQTWGKQAAGVRVTRENGAPVTFWFGLLREGFVKPLIATFTIGLDYLWPLWDAKNQALHDKSMGTRVMRTALAPATLWAPPVHPASSMAAPPVARMPLVGPERPDGVIAGGWLPPHPG